MSKQSQTLLNEIRRTRRGKSIEYIKQTQEKDNESSSESASEKMSIQEIWKRLQVAMSKSLQTQATQCNATQRNPQAN